MGMLYRRNRRVLDLRQLRSHDPKQHHIGTRGNEMRDLDATLDFDLRIDRSDPSGRILPVIHYFIRERASQTAIADDNQALPLRIVHPLGQS